MAMGDVIMKQRKPMKHCSPALSVINTHVASVIISHLNWHMQ